MRVLAVDYGERRTGLAVSDPLEITANALAVLEGKGGRNRILEEVARIAREEGAEEVVVGIPVNADGSHGPMAQAARAFGEALAERLTVPVRYQDEYYSTVEAQGNMTTAGMKRARRRREVDKHAAAVILQDYLRSRRHP